VSGVTNEHTSRVHERWAQLRFAVIGQLLTSPPPKGELQAELAKLAAQDWRHPITGDAVQFSLSTIKRWYRKAVNERHDPIGVLRRKVRSNAGRQIAVNDATRQALFSQYANHKSWSIRLHFDNLLALAETRPELRPVPSYWTVLRFFRAHGLEKRRRVTSRETEGAQRAEARLLQREVRSYEAEYVGGVFHWDFHVGSQKVLTRRAEWVKPVLFCVLDDRSRLVCHMQWYWTENAENVAHGLSQAFQKRGLPRSGLSDNGSAMLADEIVEGLNRLSVLHKTTLPYSPYMNAKIEILWAQVEGRLLAMLEGVSDLTLDFLNQVTQAWVEHDYNRKVHSETGEAPITRFLAGPEVLRPSPDSAALRLAFTKTDCRIQRKSDGTIVVSGHRFEIPNRYRHFTRLEIRYASWDLTQVHVVDERTGEVLCRLFPQNKIENASGLRRSLEPIAPRAAIPQTERLPPLLAKLLNQQFDRGLPPAYLPQGDDRKGDDGDNA
jgi:transposase InsO family protein